MKVTSEHNLAKLHPELAKEWHPTKNGDLKPTDVAPKSGQKVWWKCLKNPEHEWQVRIADRASGSGCPECYGIRRKRR